MRIKKIFSLFSMLFNRFFYRTGISSNQSLNENCNYSSDCPDVLGISDNSFSSLYFSSSYYKGTGFSFSEVISDKGRNGENKICTLLQNKFPNSQVFPNVYVQWGEHATSEIDIIFLDKTGIYVIESKYYFCDVYGAESDEYWRFEYPEKDKHSSYSLYGLNPILQNLTHVKSLSRVLNLPFSFFVPIVVFNDLCNLHVNTSSPVLSRCDLVSFLHSKIESSPPVFSSEDILLLSAFFLNGCYINTNLKLEHVDNVKRRHSN